MQYSWYHNIFEGVSMCLIKNRN